MKYNFITKQIAEEFLKEYMGKDYTIIDQSTKSNGKKPAIIDDSDEDNFYFIAFNNGMDGKGQRTIHFEFVNDFEVCRLNLNADPNGNSKVKDERTSQAFQKYILTETEMPDNTKAVYSNALVQYETQKYESELSRIASYGDYANETTDKIMYFHFNLDQKQITIEDVMNLNKKSENED